MKFVWVWSLKGLRFYLGSLIPWGFTLGLATLVIAVLIVVMNQLSRDVGKVDRTHLLIVFSNNEAEPALVQLNGYRVKTHFLRQGSQKFDAQVVNFKKIDQFFPYLQLSESNGGAVVGHALFERLHLEGAKTLQIGHHSIPLSGRLSPMGTPDDDIVFIPESYAQVLSKVPYNIHWLIKTEKSLESIRQLLPSVPLEVLDDKIRSEFIFLKDVGKFLWVLAGALIGLTFLITGLFVSKMIRARMAEISLLFALGIPLSHVLHRLRGEWCIFSAAISLMSSLFVWSLWGTFSHKIFGTVLVWDWMAVPASLLPIVLATAMAIQLSIRGIIQKNLIVSIQGGESN